MLCFRVWEEEARFIVPLFFFQAELCIISQVWQHLADVKKREIGGRKKTAVLGLNAFALSPAPIEKQK